MDVRNSSAVSAREAAELLGVKLPTLYAYVSRGLLRSVPGPDGRARRYPVAELERLRKSRRGGDGASAPQVGSSLRWGEPLMESALTRITNAGPHYRGRSAVELATEDVPFESVAELLWTGTLPVTTPNWTAPDLGAPPGALNALLPEGTPVLTALPTLVAALGARDRGRFLISDAATLERARPVRVRPALKARGVAATVAAALGARGGRAGVRAINRALVLCADHELNTSAFAARVAASSGSDLYACIGAALGAMVGPRHGGSTNRVEAMVAEAGTPEKAAEVVAARAARGETIPGFHHVLYPDGDPRATPLLVARARCAPTTRGCAPASPSWTQWPTRGCTPPWMWDWWRCARRWGCRAVRPPASSPWVAWPAGWRTSWNSATPASCSARARATSACGERRPRLR
jgi:citrate synthase